MSSTPPSSPGPMRPSPVHRHPNHLHHGPRPPFLDFNHHNASSPSSSSSASTLAGSAAMSRSAASRHPVAGPSGLAKPFNMADLAAAAIARPRAVQSWADRDSSTNCPDSPVSSAGSSPFSSPPDSPFTQPSSCALTPSSSSEGFTLGASVLNNASCLPSSPTETESLPPTPPPKPISTIVRQQSVAVSSPARIYSSPAATPPPEDWAPVDFSLKLLFTNANAGSSNSHSAADASSPDSDDDHTLPPAFFPSQRIAFSPRLRITSPEGLPFSSLGGMHLGVTGMCETLDPQGQIKNKRMIADFCIDLSSGLKIWKRDAQAARRARGKPDEPEGHERLPAGTYVLPLSMKIPNSDRLPPSFESSQFRVYYTMSIAIFSTATSSSGTPRRLKIFSLPFHVLPSTLPSPAPELPVLTHDHKKGVFASLIKSLSFSAPRAETGYHIVYPSLPTSHFSPGAHASIPVSLRIVDRPLEPTDLYIRLAIVRKTYVRESSHTSLAHAVEDEWGLGAGVSMATMGYPEEVVIEPWCKEEEEVVSRWGWVPYSSRPGADPNEKAEVVIKDIALPLSGLAGEGWTHGYSTHLDLEPTEVPPQQHGDCSWFSPAFRNRPPVQKEYGKHVHVSSRFFLSIEVGFATPALRETLESLGAESPDMSIPSPNAFTAPQRPSVSSFSGQSTSNPFYAPSSRHRHQTNPLLSPTNSSAPTPAATHAFPGRLRELFIPLTIGSVAEPSLSCIATENESAQRRAEREAREERGEDTRNEGEGPEGAWMCAPPMYDEALRSAPAYVFGEA